MATTSLHPIVANDIKAIAYIINPDKTENGLYTDSFCCSTIPDEAVKAFEMIRSKGTGQGKILAQHIHQNFKPGEVTPEQVFMIGTKLCERLLKGQYQYVLAVHTDKKHIHCHIVFNNVNMRNGRTFETLENRHGKSWEKLRKISDELCREYGLSVIQNPKQNKGKSWYEWDKSRQGLYATEGSPFREKSQLRFAVDEAIMESSNFDDFLEKCRMKNIEVVYNPNHKIDLKFRLQGQQKFTRSRTMGWYYETPQIKRRIENYKLFRDGKFAKRPKSKIINTNTEKMQDSFGLRNWAIIQNMKAASEMINKLSELGIGGTDEIEEYLITQGTMLMGMTGNLNRLKAQLDDNNDKLRAVKNYQKWLPYQHDYINTSALFKKRYEKKYASELEKFRNAEIMLYRFYPDGRSAANGHAPTPEWLEKKCDSIQSKIDSMNEEYKAKRKDVTYVDSCRQSIEKYLQNQEQSQEQSHEQKRQKKKNELE